MCGVFPVHLSLGLQKEQAASVQRGHGKPQSGLSVWSSKSTGSQVIRLLSPPYVKRLGRKKRREQVDYRNILSQAPSFSAFQISCPDGLTAL